MRTSLGSETIENSESHTFRQSTTGRARQIATYLKRTMKVIYDRETDSLLITLRDAPIRESDEVRPGVIADFGEDGGVVRFELLRASRVVDDAERVQFATIG